MTHNIQEIMAV